MKLIKLWDRVVHYIDDPKTQDDAVKIMSARVQMKPEEFKPLLKGTHLIDLAEGKKTFKKGDGLTSLYGSSKTADDFNVKNDVYKQAQDIRSEEHTSELQSRQYLVCRLLLEKKKSPNHPLY